MTSRSVAASVVALGFAGTLTVPLPAFAAPETCDSPEHYAAQSGAELLRIDRLELGSAVGNRRASEDRAGSTGDDDTDSSKPRSGTGGESPASPSRTDGASPEPTGTHPGTSPSPSGTRRSDGSPSGSGTRGSDGDPALSGTRGSGATADDGEHTARTLPAREAAGGRGAGEVMGEAHGGAPEQAVGDVGLGDVRSVLIADGPVNSAGAARILNGRVAGAAGDNDLVMQQAPPVSPKANERRTGAKRFGPVKVGAGAIMARAAWAAGMECDAAGGDTSTASAEISRVTITGGGSGALVRVPERISSRSGTALRQRAGTAQTVASATITAGRISLVDNEVRIRVLRAPELRVSMTADRQSRVDYLPAIVEVSSRGGKQTRLTTAGQHIDITLSEDMRPLESLPARLAPISEMPLPTVPNLPVLGEPESTSAPAGKPGSTLRVSLGNVRQAQEGDAIAARATAIRVSVVRNVDGGRDKAGPGPSGVVADLGIGMLEAAAVAPKGSGSAPSTGSGAGVAGLPITGPRVITLIVAGAGLVLGGICAVALTSRRRRNEP